MLREMMHTAKGTSVGIEVLEMIIKNIEEVMTL
jgi:hypothetical protein